VLTDAGYTVERDIDDTTPSVEQQEADRAGRMDERVDRLTERAGNTSRRRPDLRAAPPQVVLESTGHFVRESRRALPRRGEEPPRTPTASR
jgi:hypothetical protein